ncbi:uncharacterized protein LY89DRAFT_684593 [Mollisia scopiformis]|uniref:Uncharacterized protein n=1 Tax=Mollisia scopiformis TaxID=149040 RepID=A0A194XBP5_MOLSC|nr:uncharacterized protein LY89DRAFT_684593 [Mollisia scopiformis]KUJ17578.1 hypothetical protein LY89DRAFT_684593 [Mollisia scopiformis]
MFKKNPDKRVSNQRILSKLAISNDKFYNSARQFIRDLHSFNNDEKARSRFAETGHEF